MMRAACPKDKLELKFFSSPVNPALAGRQLICANYLKGLSTKNYYAFEITTELFLFHKFIAKTFTTSNKTLMYVSNICDIAGNRN